ncbi:colicin E3/pyocin S6 family cytotoxin [Nocardiopsis sp. NPDC058631]|uniref:colicin E3/pyocin S6 family cytotoxin n=1 Tax=Nocardiopsis sp. NPDC058631 TaxID=3346566 RepID=UPI003653479B
MVWTPIPENCFLLELNHSYKYGERRWIGEDGKFIFTWDGEHGGEVEVYNKRGRHVGVMHPVSRTLIKPAVKGRKIDV